MAKPNFAKKNITRIPSGRKRICIFMHSNMFLAVKIPEISFFNGIYETLPLKNYATIWCRAWRISYDMSSAHGEGKFCQKNITRIPSGRKRICIFMTSNRFLAVKIPEISFFNGIYETLPLKNYATLWCHAWRISYNMSSAHGEAKFCKKKITRIRNGRKRICIFMLNNGFLAVKITEISFFHFLMVFTKPCH